MAFKGEVLKGEQPAIVDRALFDAVQAKLEEQNNSHKTTRMKSEALLTGRIFDDRGNRMSPSHARKNGIKYRYYLSSALLDGRPTKAGSMSRVPAVEIETLVVKAVREHLKLEEPNDDAGIVKAHVVRVEVQADQLVVQLASTQKSKRGRPSAEQHPFMFPGTKRLRSGAVRFCCRTMDRLKPKMPDPSAPKPAQHWWHQSRAGGLGSTR